MTYQELVVSAKKLSPEQRLALMTELAQSLQMEMSMQRERPSSLARVRGMLKVEGGTPTDEELTNDYADYLIKKHKRIK